MKQREGKTTKAFASLTNQPQEPMPSRDATEWHVERNAEIRRRYSAGASLNSLAAEYGVTYQRIGQIVHGVPRHRSAPGSAPPRCAIGDRVCYQGAERVVEALRYGRADAPYEAQSIPWDWHDGIPLECGYDGAWARLSGEWVSFADVTMPPERAPVPAVDPAADLNAS